jgi:hypothetical protein
MEMGIQYAHRRDFWIVVWRPERGKRLKSSEMW